MQILFVFEKEILSKKKTKKKINFYQVLGCLFKFNLNSKIPTFFKTHFDIIL